MKNIIFFILLFLIFVSLAFYIISDKSLKLTREAEVLYRQDMITESKQKIDEALKYNKLNRRAIILSTKIKKGLNNLNNLEDAQKIYREALDDLNKKRYEAAREKLIESFELISKISDNSKLYKELNSFKDKLSNKLAMITDIIVNEYKNEAKKRYNDNDLVGAYEILENVDVYDKDINNLRNNIAFEIGLKRYNYILGEDFRVKEMFFSDTIYWFSQIDKSSQYYSESRKYIKILKEHSK